MYSIEIRDDTGKYFYTTYLPDKKTFSMTRHRFDDKTKKEVLQALVIIMTEWTKNEKEMDQREV